MMALFSPARVRFKPIGHVKMLLSGTTSITFFKTSQDNKGVRFLGTGEAFTWQPTDNHNSVLLHPLRSTIKQASLTPRDEATTFSLVYDVQTGFRGHTMRSRTNEIKRGLNLRRLSAHCFYEHPLALCRKEDCVDRDQTLRTALVDAILLSTGLPAVFGSTAMLRLNCQ
jgi:hypothetical protein